MAEEYGKTVEERDKVFEDFNDNGGREYDCGPGPSTFEAFRTSYELRLEEGSSTRRTTMARKIKITVVSGIHGDYYAVKEEGQPTRPFGCGMQKELKEYIKGAEVEWVKGRNFFKGEPVSDSLYNSMVEGVTGA